jgi:excisionase family DNA binding protein
MTAHSDRWLTIRQAALELNVSELTIRRRIKDGKLPSQLRAGKYYVKLGGVAEPASVEQPVTVSTHSSGMEPDQPDFPGGDVPQIGVIASAVDLPAILPEIARLAEEAGRSGVLRDQVHQLEERLTELQRGTVALASRNGWLESKLEERERELKLLADSRPKRRWWKRLFISS